MTTPRTAVYIPNLDGGEMVIAAVDSLREQTLDVPVVIIDNGSSDGSTDLVAQRHPDVAVVRLGRNLGVGSALNAGVRAHPASLLVFLNNDVVCEPSFIEALYEQSGPRATVAGVLLTERDPDRIDSAGVVVDRSAMAFDHLQGEPVAALASAADPLGPCGGAALVRREDFEAVGGFDERIFAYYEDADLALRLAVAGVGCRLAGEARALHRYSWTLGRGSPSKYALTGWSRGYMLRRYGVMRSPRLALHALTCETALCLGQGLFDRTLMGARGRLAGWGAARGVERCVLPEAGLLEPTVRHALRRRLARRRQ